MFYMSEASSDGDMTAQLVMRGLCVCLVPSFVETLTAFALGETISAHEARLAKDRAEKLRAPLLSARERKKSGDNRGTGALQGTAALYRKPP
mgnify:CR=1 FL=1